MPGTFQIIMYNQPENEPEFTTVYAVVENIPYEGEVSYLHTFDRKKAQKKLEELRESESDPFLNKSAYEIQVEDSIFIRLSKMSYRKQKRKSPK